MNASLRQALWLPLSLAVAMCLGACERGESKPAFHAVDITGASYAQSLALPDTDGKPRDLSEFKGKVVLVFFGYTQCPDVCPATMADLAEVKRQLGADGAKVQGVFVSIDPERDTPQVLGAYVKAFSPDFVALRGNAEQTAAAAKSFKVLYNKVPSKAGDTYTMDHTAASFLFDAQGRIRLYERYGGGAKNLLDDIKTLLAQG